MPAPSATVNVVVRLQITENWSRQLFADGTIRDEALVRWPDQKPEEKKIEERVDTAWKYTERTRQTDRLYFKDVNGCQKEEPKKREKR